MKNQVEHQYNKYIYPLPIMDLNEYRKNGNWDLTDPKYLRRKYWPKKIEPENLKILIAGCGCNQAAEIAFNNPNCEVIGIDISENSLNHQIYLKNKYDLKNLKLFKIEIENIEFLKRKFDLIISTGVLHHLVSPDIGIQKLSNALEEHGVLSIMLYGKYPRTGVYMMQEVFKAIELQQNEVDVELVIKTIAEIPKHHHLNAYINKSQDLYYKSGIVDTFLHSQDKSYSVAEILEFTEKNNLQFQSWLDNSDISLEANLQKNHPLYQKINKLPIEKQWKIIELLTQNQARQFFILSKKTKKINEFTLDFYNNNFLNYIPSIRVPTHVLRRCTSFNEPNSILKRNKEFELNFIEGKIFELIDGKKTIKMIKNKLKDKISNEQLSNFFAKMHNLDNVLFEI
jgi:SAM-dependent methyltransferase